MSDIITGYWLTRFLSSIINENHSSSSSSSSSQSYKFIVSGQRLDTSPELQSALQYFQGNDINCLLPIEQIIARFLSLGSSKSPSFFDSSPPGQFIAEWNRYKSSVFPRGHGSKIQPETVTLLTLFNSEPWHKSNQRREDYCYLGGNSSHRGVKRKAETLEDDVSMIMELCTVEAELELLIDFARNVDYAANKLESEMKERISDIETLMTRTYSLATHDEKWCMEQIKKKFEAQLDGIRGQLTELSARPQSSVLDNLVKKGYETKYKETKRAMEETPSPILYENEQQSFPSLYQYHKYLIGIKMNEVYIEFCNRINMNALIPFMENESVKAFENMIHRYHGGSDSDTPVQLDSIKAYVDTEIKNKISEMKDTEQAIDELKMKPQLISKFDQLQQYAILWDTHNNMCNTYQLISDYARPSGIIAYAMDVIKSRGKGEILTEKLKVINNHIKLSNSFLIQSVQHAVPVISEWFNQILGVFNLFVTALRSSIENMKSIITNKKLILNQTIFTWKQMTIGSHNQSSMKMLIELLTKETSSSSTGAVDLLKELKESSDSKIQSPRTVASIWNIIYTCMKLNIQSMTITTSSTSNGQQFDILDSFQSKASRI